MIVPLKFAILSKMAHSQYNKLKSIQAWCTSWLSTPVLSGDLTWPPSLSAEMKRTNQKQAVSSCSVWKHVTQEPIKTHSSPELCCTADVLAFWGRSMCTKTTTIRTQNLYDKWHKERKKRWRRALTRTRIPATTASTTTTMTAMIPPVRFFMVKVGGFSST